MSSGDFGGYGIGPRARLGTPLDEEDIGLAAHVVPAGGLNAVRIKSIKIAVVPMWDTGDYVKNETTDNYLYDAQVQVVYGMGTIDTTTTTVENWNEHEDFYVFRLTNDHEDFDVHSSTLPSETNLIDEILKNALTRLDDDDIPHIDSSQSRTSNTYTHESTPSP